MAANARILPPEEASRGKAHRKTPGYETTVAETFSHLSTDTSRTVLSPGKVHPMIAKGSQSEMSPLSGKSQTLEQNVQYQQLEQSATLQQSDKFKDYDAADSMRHSASNIDLKSLLPEAPEMIVTGKSSAGEGVESDHKAALVLASDFYRAAFNLQARRTGLDPFLPKDEAESDEKKITKPSDDQVSHQESGPSTSASGLFGPRTKAAGDSTSSGLPKGSVKEKFKRVLRRSSSSLDFIPKGIRSSRKGSTHGLSAKARQDLLASFSLEEIIRLGGWNIVCLPADCAPTSLIVPTCIAASANYLKEHGVETPGIFRVPGTQTTVNDMFDYYLRQIEEVSHGSRDIQETVGSGFLPQHMECNVHDIASVFKRYLIKLPGGILGSPRIYMALKDIHKNLHSDPSSPVEVEFRTQARMIAMCIASIASSYRVKLICAVFGILAMISRATLKAEADAEKNEKVLPPELMTSHALGICFGPALLGDLPDTLGYEGDVGDSGLDEKKKNNRRQSSTITALLNLKNAQQKAVSDAEVVDMIVARWKEINRYLKNMGVVQEGHDVVWIEKKEQDLQDGMVRSRSGSDEISCHSEKRSSEVASNQVPLTLEITRRIDDSRNSLNLSTARDSLIQDPDQHQIDGKENRRVSQESNLTALGRHHDVPYAIEHPSTFASPLEVLSRTSRAQKRRAGVWDVECDIVGRLIENERRQASNEEEFKRGRENVEDDSQLQSALSNGTEDDTTRTPYDLLGRPKAVSDTGSGLTEGLRFAQRQDDIASRQSRRAISGEGDAYMHRNLQLAEDHRGVVTQEISEQSNASDLNLNHAATKVRDFAMDANIEIASSRSSSIKMKSSPRSLSNGERNVKKVQQLVAQVENHAVGGNSKRLVYSSFPTEIEVPERASSLSPSKQLMREKRKSMPPPKTVPIAHTDHKRQLSAPKSLRDVRQISLHSLMTPISVATPQHLSHVPASADGPSNHELVPLAGPERMSRRASRLQEYVNLVIIEARGFEEDMLRLKDKNLM